MHHFDLMNQSDVTIGRNTANCLNTVIKGETFVSVTINTLMQVHWATIIPRFLFHTAAKNEDTIDKLVT